jgi:hypothetical protein
MMEQSKMREEYVDDNSSLGGDSSNVAEDSTSDHVTSSTSNDIDEAENQYFGQSENRNVKSLKHLVFLVLFLVTLAVCLVIYFLTRKGQQDEFEAS